MSGPVKLATILGDSCFQSYFAAYLELPVFGIQLRYWHDDAETADGNIGAKSGFVDGEPFINTGNWPPPPASNEGVEDAVPHDEQPLFKFVQDELYPLFLHTDLYLEYSLAKLLSSPSEGMQQLGLQETELSALLGNYTGITEFKDFLAPRAGNPYFHFWIDVMRLRQWQAQSVSIDQSLRDLRERYFRPGSPLELSSTLFAGIELINRSGNVNPRELSVAADLALMRLRQYWVPRFIAHVRVRPGVSGRANASAVKSEPPALPPTMSPSREHAQSQIGHSGPIALPDQADMLAIALASSSTTPHATKADMHATTRRGASFSQLIPVADTPLTMNDLLRIGTPSPGGSPSKNGTRPSSGGTGDISSSSSTGISGLHSRSPSCPAPRTLLSLSRRPVSVVPEPAWVRNASSDNLEVALAEAMMLGRMETPQDSGRKVHRGVDLHDVPFDEVLKFDVLAGGPFELYLEKEIGALRLHPVLLTHYMFWSDVDQFKRTPIPDVRALKFLARNIHSNYIAPTAPYDIGLEQKDRETLQKQLLCPSLSMYTKAQALVATMLEPHWAGYTTHMVATLEAIGLRDSGFKRRQQKLELLAQPPQSVLEEERRQHDQLMLQIAMETLNLVILTMLEPWEYRDIVLEAIDEIEKGIGVELIGTTELKAALLLFLGLTSGDRLDEAPHFKVFLEERNMLDHARLWADCEEYSRMGLKRPAYKKRLDGRARAIFRFYQGYTEYWADSQASLPGGEFPEHFKPTSIAIEFTQGKAWDVVAKLAVEFKDTPEYKKRHEQQQQKKSKKEKTGPGRAHGRKSQTTTPLDILDFVNMLSDHANFDEFVKFLMALKGEDSPKLVRDLKFWAEVRRYKQMVHLHKCEKLAKQKMKVIVSTYVEPMPNGLVPIHITEDHAKFLRIRANSSKPSTVYVFRAAQEGVFGQIFKHQAAFRTHRLEARSKSRLGRGMRSPSQKKVVPVIRRGKNSANADGSGKRGGYKTNMVARIVSSESGSAPTPGGGPPSNRAATAFSLEHGLVHVAPSRERRMSLDAGDAIPAGGSGSSPRP